MTTALQPVDAPPAQEIPLAATGPTARADLKMLAYWISLAASAGGLAGFVVGGIGGRLAMFILRLTSDDSVRGLESDDGFIIGRFNLGATASLFVTTMVMSSIVALIVAAGRPFFPRKHMEIAWGVAGALLGGALFIHSDGVDFTLLEPHWLAVAMFIALPAMAGILIALLIGLYPRFWWRRRWLTAAACIPAIPAIVFFPLGIVTSVVAAAWFTVLRFDRGRRFAQWPPARVAAIAVFVGLVVLGAVDLTRDVREIL